jgi:hypothetical protein
MRQERWTHNLTNGSAGPATLLGQDPSPACKGLLLLFLAALTHSSTAPAHALLHRDLPYVGLELAVEAQHLTPSLITFLPR